MTRPPDIVPDVPEEKLRAVYGPDADEIIAFRRFLQLPHDETGRVICPPHWHAYARGEIGAVEVLRRDSR